MILCNVISWKLTYEKFHSIIGIVGFIDLLVLTQLWFSTSSYVLHRLYISQMSSYQFLWFMGLEATFVVA